MTSNKDKNKKANEILYAFSIIGAYYREGDR